MKDKNNEKKTQSDDKKKNSKKIDKEEAEVEVVEKEVVREVIVEKRVGFNCLEVILIMIITLIIGGFLGNFLAVFDGKEVEVKEEVTTSQFDEFIETYNDIKENYYEELDEEELLDAGIKGMLDFLDDEYSFYMDKEETEAFNEQVEGKYNGIGVEIQLTDSGVVISRIFENTPAERAGLQIGDMFLKVGDEDVSEKYPAEISSIIKTSDTNKITVTVKRDNEEKEFSLTLEEVQIESVTSKIIDKNNKKIGYIYLSVFASNTYQQFLNELTKLEVEEIDSLVIDVRDNTGGYLNCVTNIASLFLEKGKVIYQLDTRGVVEKFTDSTKNSRDYSVAVLINGASASASEILASALQESYGATIVGTNSYGKGTVQRAYQLESGATVKYTIQKWLTPDGNWINEVGVEPDFKVELSEDYYENPSDESDNQLQKALDEISK